MFVFTCVFTSIDAQNLKSNHICIHNYIHTHVLYSKTVYTYVLICRHVYIDTCACIHILWLQINTGLGETGYSKN